MRRVLVTGASGFIGAHLVGRLKREGHWVRAVSRSHPPFSPSMADEYLALDLRDKENCERAVRAGGAVDEVYHMAADMGGIGYISAAEYDVMRSNALIDINMAEAAARSGVARFFFPSSVCVYRDMDAGEGPLTEDDAIPARPDNAYGWAKLFSELLLARCAARSGMTVRMARLQTSYGPEGTWTGGREKAPAALCRKVAEARDGETIEVWGDGTAIRSYLFIDDLVDAILLLTNSSLDGPVNIGSPDYVSVRELVERVIALSGKTVHVRYVPGPTGVQSRNFSNDRIYSIGWRPKVPLEIGLQKTYDWIHEQVAGRTGR